MPLTPAGSQERHGHRGPFAKKHRPHQVAAVMGPAGRGGAGPLDSAHSGGNAKQHLPPEKQPVSRDRRPRNQFPSPVTQCVYTRDGPKRPSEPGRQWMCEEVSTAGHSTHRRRDHGARRPHKQGDSHAATARACPAHVPGVGNSEIRTQNGKAGVPNHVTQGPWKRLMATSIY